MWPLGTPASPLARHDEGASPSTRRAPFSDNPRVGARGQRTRQRILDAALQLFGDEGFHRCSIARISEQADCSRVSFYQYFSSKEDVFSQSGRPGRPPDQRLHGGHRSADGRGAPAGTACGPGSAGTETSTRAMGRSSRRSRPRFAGGRRDASPGAARLRDETVARHPLEALDAAICRHRQLDPLCSSLLLACLARTLDDAATLRVVRPAGLHEGAGRDRLHRRHASRRSSAAATSTCSRRPRRPIRRGWNSARSSGHVGEGGGDPMQHRAAGRPEALIDNGRDVFVQPRLPRHPGGRPGRCGRGLPRRLLPLLREQGSVGDRPYGAGDARRRRRLRRDPRPDDLRQPRTCSDGCGATTPRNPVRRP